MSKTVSVGEYLISIDSIVSIHLYELNKREYIDNKKSYGFIGELISLFKKEEYDGHEVYYDYFGHGYILRGTHRRMSLFLSNGKEIDDFYDESVVNLWKQNKQ